MQGLENNHQDNGEEKRHEKAGHHLEEENRNGQDDTKQDVEGDESGHTGFTNEWVTGESKARVSL